MQYVVLRTVVVYPNWVAQPGKAAEAAVNAATSWKIAAVVAARVDGLIHRDDHPDPVLGDEDSLTSWTYDAALRANKMLHR